MRVITPLLPVKGLRRDDKGELTEDAIKTILEGLKSLGIQVDSDATRDAVLHESRTALCRLNSQIQYLLNQYFSDVGHSLVVDPTIMTIIKEKNQAMQDILSLSRQVIAMYPFKTEGDFIEGFLGTTMGDRSAMLKALKEEFQDVDSTVVSRHQILEKKNLEELMGRGLQDTEVQNTFAARQLELYTFLNVVAVGLLFYIYTAK